MVPARPRPTSPIRTGAASSMGRSSADGIVPPTKDRPVPRGTAVPIVRSDWVKDILPRRARLESARGVPPNSPRAAGRPRAARPPRDPPGVATDIPLPEPTFAVAISHSTYDQPAVEVERSAGQITERNRAGVRTTRSKRSSEELPDFGLDNGVHLTGRPHRAQSDRDRWAAPNRRRDRRP